MVVDDPAGRPEHAPGIVSGNLDRVVTARPLLAVADGFPDTERFHVQSPARLDSGAHDYSAVAASRIAPAIISMSRFKVVMAFLGVVAVYWYCTPATDSVNQYARALC